MPLPNRSLPMFARCWFLQAVMVASFLFAGVAAQDKAQPGSLEPAAKAFVELLDKGEFAKATESFDAAMLKALPAAELKKTWEKVVSDAGAFKKQLSTRKETKGKYDVVYVTCEFAKTK